MASGSFGAASAIIERRRHGGGSYNEKTLAPRSGLSCKPSALSIIVRRRKSASDNLAEEALFD
jgi:hypothetical protein